MAEALLSVVDLLLSVFGTRSYKCTLVTTSSHGSLGIGADGRLLLVAVLLIFCSEGAVVE